MKIRFAFWKIDRIENNCECSDDIFTTFVPREEVEAANMTEAMTARDVYLAKAMASGHCGRVLTYKVGKDRAFPGFKDFELAKPMVNREVGLNAV